MRGLGGDLVMECRHKLLWHDQEYWISSNLARFEEDDHRRYVTP